MSIEKALVCVGTSNTNERFFSQRHAKHISATQEYLIMPLSQRQQLRKDFLSKQSEGDERHEKSNAKSICQ